MRTQSDSVISITGMTDYALEQLKKKRAEMTGEIARCHARLQQLSTDLEHIDATISSRHDASCA